MWHVYDYEYCHYVEESRYCTGVYLGETKHTLPMYVALRSLHMMSGIVLRLLCKEFDCKLRGNPNMLAWAKALHAKLGIDPDSPDARAMIEKMEKKSRGKNKMRRKAPRSKKSPKHRCRSRK